MAQHAFSLSQAALKDWIIVIIDDTPDNLAIAETTLRYQGARVYTATNGVEGLELLKTVAPTIVLMDIRMPRMDGWNTLKTLRATPEFVRIPVVAITAYAMDSDREAIIAAGFDGYIAKPFDVFSLASTLKACVTESIQKHESKDASAL